MAETVGHAVVKVHADGSGMDREVRKEFDDLQPTFQKAGEESGETFNEAWTKEFQKGLKQLDKDFANQNRGFRSQLTKTSKQIGNILDVETGQKVVDAFRDWRIEVEETERAFDDLDRSLVRHSTTVKRTEVDYDRLILKVRETRQSSDRLADALARGFGKGSRNDFINIIGSMVGGLSRLTTGFTNFLTGTSEFGVRMGQIIASFGDGENAISRFGEAIARTFARGGGGAGGAIAAVPFLLIAVHTALGLMASSITGVIGLIISLASTLAYGLTGALAVAGGAIVPFVAGIGTIITAIQNLSKEQKKALEPVGEAFKRLGDAAADTFGDALVRNADRFVKVLEAMEPIARRVGNAMGRVLDRFMKDITGPEFNQFRREFGNFLPQAVEDMGDALSDFAQGAAGVFRALMPFVSEFLGWLAGIAQEFNQWANSARGQNALSSFFEKATESAKVLGDFIWALGEAIGALFSAGKDTGDQLFKDMTGALQEFSKWAKSGEGKRSLDEFFDFVLDLGREIGDVIMAAGRLIDAFDTKQSRQNLLRLLDAIEKIIDAVAWLVDKFNKVTAAISGIGDTVRGAFGGIGGRIRGQFSFLSGFADWIRNKIGKIKIIDLFQIPTIASLVSDFRNFGDTVRKFIGKIPIKDLFDIPSVSSLVDSFRNFAETVRRYIGKIKLGDLFEIPSLSEIASKFSSLGDMIENAIGTISIDVAANLSGISDKVRRLIGLASGGIVLGAQNRLVGEEGPEAVVPLNRPLHRVDPSVRALSAIAQGLDVPAGTLPATGTASQRPIELTIVTPTKDPYAVALETINRLTAVGY